MVHRSSDGIGVRSGTSLDGSELQPELQLNAVVSILSNAHLGLRPSVGLLGSVGVGCCCGQDDGQLHSASPATDPRQAGGWLVSRADAPWVEGLTPLPRRAAHGFVSHDHTLPAVAVDLADPLDDPAPAPPATDTHPHGGVARGGAALFQTVPELLTRFGADGWELVALQEHREGGMGTSYWDAICSVATYTFKRPVPFPG
jgi:hypothetical protein